MQTAIQTSMQASIQQLGESLATRLNILNTTLKTRMDLQNQQVVNNQQPLPPQQPQRHQHQLPAPIRQQRQQQPQNQRYNPMREGRAQQGHSDDENELHRQLYFDDLQHNYDNRWENSFRVDIPEFHGGLRGDDLIDWLVSVEEILEFKQVPPARRVSLVAMRFRGHAATWWKQLKTTRSRTGKAPIQSWEKLTKHLRQTFLPHNYERTMYTKLQNLRQGNRSVDDYAEEFALLLTRNEVNDSQIQLVSRFSGGLRPQLQASMAQFDPSTVGEAHRHAASFEQQSRSSNWNPASVRPRNLDQSTSNTPSSSAKELSDVANSSVKPITQDEQQLR